MSEKDEDEAVTDIVEHKQLWSNARGEVGLDSSLFLTEEGGHLEGVTAQSNGVELLRIK